MTESVIYEVKNRVGARVGGSFSSLDDALDKLRERRESGAFPPYKLIKIVHTEVIPPEPKDHVMIYNDQRYGSKWRMGVTTSRMGEDIGRPDTKSNVEARIADLQAQFPNTEYKAVKIA